MATSEEKWRLEHDHEKQRTACPDEPDQHGHTTSSSSSSSYTLLLGRAPAAFRPLIGVGDGLHSFFAADEQIGTPRLLPHSLYVFIHDGGLHRCIGRCFVLRVWLLFLIFVPVTLALLVPLLPVVVGWRFFWLLSMGRSLAEMGDWAWYLPYGPLVYVCVCGYELVFYICWQIYRWREAEVFGNTYRFPIVYMCARVTEHYTARVLPARVTKRLAYGKKGIPT